MSEKHIFIGLGGAGVNTVSQIKYKVYRRTQGTGLKSRIQVMSETYRFMFIDTDSRDVRVANQRYRNEYEGGKTEFIGEHELINLGDMNPAFIYEEAKKKQDSQINRRITEACSQRVADQMENRNLFFGAGAIRLKSRIAFGRKEQEFVELLKTNIDLLNTIENDNETNVIHYWVVASCNGGTGSGIVQDVLYLINMVHRSEIDQGNPKLGLILYMPRIYMNMNSNNLKYPCNAYAVMSELECFEAWSKDDEKSKLFHQMAMINTHPLFQDTFSYRPFEFCIPIDFHTEDKNNMGDIYKMYSNTAELVYYIHGGVGARGFKSFLDNYQEGAEPGGDNKFLIPMGYMAIRKPEEQFENYVEARSKYEMLRYGIIGSPIESAEDRKSAAMTVFQSIIASRVFNTGVTNYQTYFTRVAAIINSRIEEDFPENVIQNEKGDNIVNTLPPNLSIESANGSLKAINAAISGLSGEKKNTSREIERELWNWTESAARSFGLQYVKDVLLALDAYCTELYVAFTTDTKPEVLQDLGLKSRAQLTSDCTSIDLGKLYQKALDKTFKERVFKQNREDVSDFFSKLKGWVEDSAALLFADEAFGLIKDLSYGDNGVIDRILAHVRQMLSSATSLLNGQNGVWQGYTRLAKSFFTAKMDITTIYLPDITEFVDGYGWREEGNIFSQWYSRVIARDSVFVEREGYLPIRKGDKCSLEAIISDMLNRFEENMVQQKYIVDNNSHLFTCSEKNNKKKVIEDILDYTVLSVKALIHEDETICNQWYEKRLEHFYEELDNERSIEIRQRVKPVVFFPHNLAQGEGIRKEFCIGPQGVAETLFVGTDAQDIMQSEESTAMYKFVTLLGVPFESYDLYESLKNTYRKAVGRELYHFHKEFAQAGGQFDAFRLPKKAGPELIVFAKLLLLNQICRDLKQWIRRETDPANKADYAPSPVMRGARTMKFAKFGALNFDKDLIEIRTIDDGIECFITVALQRIDYKWTDFVNGFTEQCYDCGFMSIAEDLIQALYKRSGDNLRGKYSLSINRLKRELNDDYAASNAPGEQETIKAILGVLEENINTFDKFISNTYYH